MENLAKNSLQTEDVLPVLGRWSALGIVLAISKKYFSFVYVKKLASFVKHSTIKGKIYKKYNVQAYTIITIQ